MGPKKAKEVIVGGYNLAEMTVEELQEFAMKLEEEIERTREERNFFQLERDKVVQFWEVTKKELAVKNNELLLKSCKIEDMDLSVTVQLQENMQKVKQLEYEYNKCMREHEIQKAADERDMGERHQKEQDLLMEKIKDHEFTISEMKFRYEDMIRQLKLKQDEELHDIKLLHEKKLLDTVTKYEKMMLNLQDAMDLQKRVEINEIEDSKNSDIRSFMEVHSQDFERMQGYFKDITLKNLALISNLKEEIESVKRSEDEMKNKLAKVFNENDSLRHVKLEVEQLKQCLVNYDRDKISLSLARKRLTECSEKAKVLEFENEVLSQLLVTTKKQKEDLHNQFVSTLRSIQDRCGLKSIFLENKLKAMEQSREAGTSSSDFSTEPVDASYSTPLSSAGKECQVPSTDEKKSSASGKEELPINRSSFPPSNFKPSRKKS